MPKNGGRRNGTSDIIILVGQTQSCCSTYAARRHKTPLAFVARRGFVVIGYSLWLKGGGCLPKPGHGSKPHPGVGPQLASQQYNHFTLSLWKRQPYNQLRAGNKRYTPQIQVTADTPRSPSYHNASFTPPITCIPRLYRSTVLFFTALMLDKP